MSKISSTELSKITYLDPTVVQGRTLLLMPFWDGFNWHMWIDGPEGTVIKIQVIKPVHAKYVAKHRELETDIWIQFVDHMWQRASWPDVSRFIFGIGDDFHCLATSVAKLKYFFKTQSAVEQALISSFARTELEYLLTVARSVFDLLQEAISEIWNAKITLVDSSFEAIKKRHKLPKTFTKVALCERSKTRTSDELVEAYAIPQILAEQYERFAPFFLSLLKARDRIVHGGSSVETIFATEKGFCVDPRARTFSDFPWLPEHYYNENIVSILPWLAHAIFGTIEACNDLMGAFASVIEMPPAIAPGFHIFIRDPANSELIGLQKAASGENIWWSDEVAAASQPLGVS